ncbi:MAG: hypothetical protein ABIN96_08185 [Rubrivivax sp.]
MKPGAGAAIGAAFGAGWNAIVFRFLLAFLLAFLLGFASTAALAQSAASAAEAGSDWQVVGRQGIVRMVIVPMADARDREAYVREVDKLCAPGGSSCFLNFYTNSTGAEASLPLPEAISNEATAVFRRSAKQGAELVRFSCRLQMPGEDCF